MQPCTERIQTGSLEICCLQPIITLNCEECKKCERTLEICKQYFVFFILDCMLKDCEHVCSDLEF